MTGSDWTAFMVLATITVAIGGFLLYVTAAPGHDELVQVEECQLFLHLDPFAAQMQTWLRDRPERTPAFKVWEGDHPNCTVEINGVMHFDWPRRHLVWEAAAREGTDIIQAISKVGLPIGGVYISQVHLKPSFVSFTATFQLPEEQPSTPRTPYDHRVGSELGSQRAAGAAVARVRHV